MNNPIPFSPTGSDKKDPTVDITRAILERVFKDAIQKGCAFRLWDDQTLFVTGESKPVATIHLTHPGALRKMFLPPGELTLGEAYLRGDYDIEGDIVEVIQLITMIDALSSKDLLYLFKQVLKLPNSDPPQIFRKGRQPARLAGTLHSRDRDRLAVTYHYDTGNEFYQLFLGQWMTYSCAYFSTPQTDLDTAQEAKLNYLCRKLRLRPGERLLDIGCGWGGLVGYAARKYGVRSLGITLSEPQVEYGNEWLRKVGLSERARLEVRDYRDMASYEPFDKIVSVGMIEHVGRKKQAEYFDCAFRALRPGGLFLNHGIADQSLHRPSWFEKTFIQRGQFSNRYVFPDGEVIPISEALMVAERAGFEVRDVESLREHYALTLRHWIKNLETNHSEVLRLKDERTYRTWRLFMSASAHGFESGDLNIFQALLSKSTGGNAEIPITRKDLYY